MPSLLSHAVDTPSLIDRMSGLAGDDISFQPFNLNTIESSNSSKSKDPAVPDLILLDFTRYDPEPVSVALSGKGIKAPIFVLPPILENAANNENRQLVQQPSLSANIINLPDRDPNRILKVIGDHLKRLAKRKQVSLLLRQETKELTKLQAAIASSPKFTDQLLNLVPAGVVVLDSDGRIVFSNRHFQTLVSRDFATLNHCRIDDILGSDIWPFLDQLEASQMTSEIHETDIEMKSSSGDKHTLTICALPFVDSNQIVGTTLSITDNTDKITALKTAKAANESRTQFLANMSHELRTPLNAIMGFAELLGLEKFGKSQDQRVEYSQIILNASKHLLSMLNSLLDLSKIEANEMKVRLEETSADNLVNECCKLFELDAQSKKVNLITAIEPFTVQTDQKLLRQVMINLISNALKFTPVGGSITVTGKVKEGSYQIIVQDTGIGMSEDELAKAMGRFVQIENSFTKTVEGTGLGLSLVDRICEILNIKLRLSSKPDEGTRIELVLPMEQETSS